MNFKLKQGTENLQNNGGLVLTGKKLEAIHAKQFILERAPGGKRRKNRTFNTIMSWLALLEQGRSQFSDITLFDQDPLFKESHGIQRVYSEARFRQITEEMSNPHTMQILNDLNLCLLEGKTFGMITSDQYGTEYIPCDIDVSPFNNSKSSKEGVSFTYKLFDGYSPIFAYIGQEGYMLSCQLRPGKQHCQQGTPEFIADVIERLKQLNILDKVLFRLDSGNDAAENIRVLNEAEAKFIIKRNRRKENVEQWLECGRTLGSTATPREGKQVHTATVSHISPAGFTEEDRPVEIVVQACERTIDKHGNQLLIPTISIDSYWTNIGEQPSTVINFYHDHGTSEQFHSEVKSDMDLERFASGKFRTNALILALGMLSFNLLREVGMKLIEFKQSAPLKITVMRTRVKTVLRDLIYIACKVTSHGGYRELVFGKQCKWYQVFKAIYLSYG